MEEAAFNSFSTDLLMAVLSTVWLSTTKNSRNTRTTLGAFVIIVYNVTFASYYNALTKIIVHLHFVKD